jgi:hypothetical protein
VRGFADREQGRVNPFFDREATADSHVIVVLPDLAPTDIATAGSVAFDDVGLFVR